MKNHNIEEVPGFDFVGFSNREEIWAKDKLCERMTKVHKGFRVAGVREGERVKNGPCEFAKFTAICQTQ
jgi:hypothetical protein